jgi:hypothetical protein
MIIFNKKKYPTLIHAFIDQKIIAVVDIESLRSSYPDLYIIYNKIIQRQKYKKFTYNMDRVSVKAYDLNLVNITLNGTSRFYRGSVPSVHYFINKNGIRNL